MSKFLILTFRLLAHVTVGMWSFQNLTMTDLNTSLVITSGCWHFHPDTTSNTFVTCVLSDTHHNTHHLSGDPMTSVTETRLHSSSSKQSLDHMKLWRFINLWYKQRYIVVLAVISVCHSDYSIKRVKGKSSMYGFWEFPQLVSLSFLGYNLRGHVPVALASQLS